MNNPLTPGEIIRERDRIVQLLGKGGFGGVYLARDMNPGTLRSQGIYTKKPRVSYRAKQNS